MEVLDKRGYKRYWDEERETMNPVERERIILERIRLQLDYVYHKLPFYRKLYDEAKLRIEEIRSLEDFTTKVPIVTKKMLVEDQVANPPFGSYAGTFDAESCVRSCVQNGFWNEE